MIAAATSQQAQAIARAAYTVATTGGTTPLSGADRRAITTRWSPCSVTAILSTSNVSPRSTRSTSSESSRKTPCV